MKVAISGKGQDKYRWVSPTKKGKIASWESLAALVKTSPG